jgi:hypothetical protein
MYTKLHKFPKPNIIHHTPFTFVNVGLNFCLKLYNKQLQQLQTDCILDKIDEYRRNWLLHLQRIPQNRIPLKIIPLQPTRKENNWKTKETMERATVTLEMEWSKWPNPGCL